MVQEEHTRWEAIGLRQMCEAETIDHECVARAAVRGLCFLPTLVWGQGLIVTRADSNIKMMVEVHQPGLTAFIIWGIR